MGRPTAARLRWTGSPKASSDGFLCHNVGKGHALRRGLGLGHGRYLGFIDADGDISPDLLASFVSIIHAEGPTSSSGVSGTRNPPCTTPRCGGSIRWGTSA